MKPRGRRDSGTFPTTADAGLWARGDSPPALFEALGRGFYSLMTDRRRVRATQQRRVSAEGRDPPSLLVAFLTELIALKDAEGFLGRDLTVRLDGNPPNRVNATIWGEDWDPSRHVERWDIKAATFHQLQLDLQRGRARVIVDL